MLAILKPISFDKYLILTLNRAVTKFKFIVNVVKRKHKSKTFMTIPVIRNTWQSVILVFIKGCAFKWTHPLWQLQRKKSFLVITHTLQTNVTRIFCFSRQFKRYLLIKVRTKIKELDTADMLADKVYINLTKVLVHT